MSNAREPEVFRPDPNATPPAQVDEAKRKKFLSLRDQLVKSKGQIAAALPRHMNAERLIRIALTTYNKTPDLQECTIPSILQATMEAAQLGLECDGILGHAYLVPFRDNRANCMKATMIPGYKGFIALAYRSGLVESLSGHAVHANDHFEFELGLNEKLVHVPTSEDEPGPTTHAYAVCRMKDGGHAMIVLNRAQVESFRARSKARNSPAWRDDWDAMAVKTCVRQLAKWMPQCVELQRAAAVEEAVDLDIDPMMDDDAIDVTDDGIRRDASNSLKDKLQQQNASGARAQFSANAPPPPDPEPGSRG